MASRTEGERASPHMQRAGGGLAWLPRSPVAAMIINGWNLFLAGRKDVLPSELLWRNTRATEDDQFPKVK